jgi:MIP family channel proteins
MTMVYVIGPISGSHINPAVSLAMYLAKKIDQSTFIGYVIAQLIGAAVASFVLLALFPQSVATINLGATMLRETITPSLGMFIEAILTFILVLVVLMTTMKENHHAGLAIGATIAFNHLFGISLTGSSMNPARSFGPALASGYWTNQLVWWIGPIIGAVLAYVAWKQIAKNGK